MSSDLKNSKKLYLKTYGCQMNFYDSGRMKDVLRPHGFEEVEDYQGAELVVLNTCHIREKATEKVYSELGRIEKEKKKMEAEGKQMIIAVAGCTAQAEGDIIKSRAPFVDLVVGSQAYQRLPEMVANAGKANNGNIIELDFETQEKFDQLPEESEPQGPSAFLTIQEGCDKFCHFCVVPYTRGAEFSRSVPEVTREAIKLVEQGSKEITLLGQNVNAYHGAALDGEVFNMAQLIRRLADIGGLERIRYTTSHPRDVDEDLLRVHGEVPELMPFLHLPVQSGSNATLKAMNRKHTRDDYLKTIEGFKKYRPDMQFSSDFIVGFPGETDEDFRDTIKLVEEVGYAQAYSFKYSPRAGTPAAMREDSVPESVKTERLAELQALLNAQQIAYNEQFVGTVVEVLFDRVGKKEGQLVGKTPMMQSVTLDADMSLLGETVDVMVNAANPNGLSGTVMQSSARVAAL